MQVASIMLVLGFVWLFLLTGLNLYNYLILSKIKKQSGNKDFLKVFKEVVDDNTKLKSEIKSVKKILEVSEKEAQKHLQKLGLVRYNPFEETGGDHSFTLSLLDNNDNGVLLTGLHTRERTRIYIKDITEGKSKLELSKEEIKAIKKAN